MKAEMNPYAVVIAILVALLLFFIIYSIATNTIRGALP